MNLVVLGLQWGDEGKGKAIDYLANDFDIIVRYQGGHNAGHTIYYKGQKVILHLLPSGIFSPETVSIIGNGVVVNPIQLINEIKNMQKLGIDLKNLVLSNYAPIILPDHQNLDIVFENSRYVKIGTTRRGIGPAYEDLTGRRAIFVSDLFDRDCFYKKVKPLNSYYNKLSCVQNGKEIDLDSYIDDYIEAGKFLREYAGNTTEILHNYFSQGKKILFEGAQGALLDINFGTYPFVTSSNSTISGVLSGTGLSHKAIGRVVGISKSYATRVGGGPFPSELFDDEAHFLREKGHEYGSTTGRPRRVGWLDLIGLKYSIAINGVDAIFFTKLDVLDDFDQIKVVTGYELAGETRQTFEPGIDFLNRVTPVLKSFPGWQTDLTGIREYRDLPQQAKEYIRFIEGFINVPIAYISVGTDRDQTIKREL